MTRIDKVLQKLSDLYEFNRKIKAYELRRRETTNKSLKSTGKVRGSWERQRPSG